jgi:isoquinoline 1-oxidoreductase
MVYAKVAYPPTREGSKVVSVDDAAAKRVKGYIRTVVVGDLVAVVADSYENAVKARDALKVNWNPGPYAKVTSESIFQEYAKKAKEDTASPSWVEQGDIRAGFGQAAKTHEATFVTDYVAHMQMEPMNCVVRVDNNGVYDIYTGSQFQTMAVGTLTKALGVKESQIRIHQHYLGGGFGRRLEPDVMLEGALIAREVKRPVKLIRSREEDLRRDYYRSATLQMVKAGVDGNGRVVAWQNTLVAAYPGERYGGLDDKGRDQFALNGADHVYDIPNQFVRAIRAETGMSVGYVRAVAPNYTFFAVETFMDELARLAGVDPLQFRLNHLSSSPRLANVLKLAATRAGWGTPLPANVGRGLACVTAQERKSPTWTASVV